MQHARAVMQNLSEPQLVALCRYRLGLPVRASDLPSGVAAPASDEVGVLQAEIGRRRLGGLIPSAGPDVMGAAEAAAALGVKQTNLRTVAGLPAPIARLRATALWDGAAIRRLAAERRRRKTMLDA